MDYAQIGPGYLATLGIALVAGREFTRDDDERSDPVAIVNEPMAERGTGAAGIPWAGAWLSADDRCASSGSRSFSKYPRSHGTVPAVLLRAAAPVERVGPNFDDSETLSPAAIVMALTSEVRALDASLTPDLPMTMREQINRMNQSTAMAVMLLTAFGGTALIMAAIGLYGVMSFNVTQNARELALRLALGANRSILLRRVLAGGLLLTGGGVVCGAVAALGLTKLLGTLLYDVNPRDPASVFAGGRDDGCRRGRGVRRSCLACHPNRPSHCAARVTVVAHIGSTGKRAGLNLIRVSSSCKLRILGMGRKTKERFVAGFAGHVDSADTVAARPARIRHRPVHSTIVRE